MNQKLFRFSFCIGLAVACGCASDRFKPPEVFSGTQSSVPPPELTLNETEIVQRAAGQPPAPLPGEGWKPLFDGQTFNGWKITEFGGQGRVAITNNMFVLPHGTPFTGVSCTNQTPTMNYEIALEAMRISGSDFFCGLTFPVRDSFCSLIIGGWGGSIVGLSNLDGADASENETTQYISFETGRWYRIRLRVSENKIEAWVEQKKVVNVTTTGRKISLRFGEIELSKPLGVACWDTGAAMREIRLRPVLGPDSPTE